MAQKPGKSEYASFLDLLTIPACQTDFPIRRFIHVNDAVCRLLGYSREEVMARPPFDFIDKDSLGRMLTRTRMVFAGEPLENNVTVRITTKSGRGVDLQIYPKLLFRYGLPCGALAVGHDLTKINELEASLKESEAYARNLITYAPAAIYEIDLANRRLLKVNDYMCRMLGYSRKELLAMDANNILMPDSRKIFAERIRKTLAGEKVERSVEYQAVAKDGRIIYGMLNVTVSPGGHPVALVVAHDITESKLAEEKLRAAEAVLRRDNLALGKLVEEKTREALAIKRLADIGALAATVAHELRNPLAVIKMAVFNLKKKLGGAGTDAHLQNIDSKVNESEQIINNLLFYSRLQPPSFQDVNLTEILEEALAQFAFSHPGVRAIRDFGALKDRPVESDPVQITELVKNILSNAIDAVDDFPAGQVKVAARIDPKNNLLELTISDNGVGIAPVDLNRIMDPFFSTKKGGTGLGLAVAGRIVELHRGQISFSSQPGQGTSVAIKLPLRQAIS